MLVEFGVECVGETQICGAGAQFGMTESPEIDADAIATDHLDGSAIDPPADWSHLHDRAPLIVQAGPEIHGGRQAHVEALTRQGQQARKVAAESGAASYMDVLRNADVRTRFADLNRPVLGDLRIPMVVGALIPRPDAWGRNVGHVHADFLRACTPEIQIWFVDALLVRSDMSGIDIGHVHARDVSVTAERDRGRNLGVGGLLECRVGEHGHKRNHTIGNSGCRSGRAATRRRLKQRLVITGGEKETSDGGPEGSSPHGGTLFRSIPWRCTAQHEFDGVLVECIHSPRPSVRASLQNRQSILCPREWPGLGSSTTATGSVVLPRAKRLVEDVCQADAGLA